MDLPRYHAQPVVPWVGHTASTRDQAASMHGLIQPSINPVHDCCVSGYR